MAEGRACGNFCPARQLRATYGWRGKAIDSSLLIKGYSCTGTARQQGANKISHRWIAYGSRLSITSQSSRGRPVTSWASLGVNNAWHQVGSPGERPVKRRPDTVNWPYHSMNPHVGFGSYLRDPAPEAGLSQKPITRGPKAWYGAKAIRLREVVSKTCGRRHAGTA